MEYHRGYIPSNGWMITVWIFLCEEGTATIEIGSSEAGDLYCMTNISFDYADILYLKVDATPCDSKSANETKLLKNLTGVYGNHVISGQQEIYGSGNNGNYELELITF